MTGTGTAVAQDAPEPVSLLEELDFPAGLAFSNDWRTMFFSERDGRILRLDRASGGPQVVAEISTTTDGETGLLGIAVSPDDRFVYAFVTDETQSSNRIVRVPVEGGEAETVVDGLPADVYHNGGGVAFDADGMLLVSNGETHADSIAQDPDALGGKIYRFTPEGEPAAGNPFGASIALGLRNPFGLTVDPDTGSIFVTENGPSSFDEINRIERGGNYGWPDTTGPAGSDFEPSGPGDYSDPLLAYEDIIVPTGIAVAAERNALPEYRGNLFFGTYGEATIHRVVLTPSQTEATSDEVFLQEEDPVVALAWGPDGLYYTTPDAVKLLPLAGTDRGQDDDGGRRIVGPPLRPEAGSNRTVGLIVGAAVLAAILAFIFWARRDRS